MTKNCQNTQILTLQGAPLYDGTVASTDSDLKCKNFKILTILAHFGQNWLILSTTDLGVSVKIIIFHFWPLKNIQTC